MSQSTQRLLSLDAFRGLTMAGMILVNNPGSWSHVYAPLRHAEWHGWTPTDLVFPFFLFIVGVAIKLSMDKYLRISARRQMLLRIIRRTVLLFALGLFLNGLFEFDVSTWRIPGVLQRIAVCYFFASLIYMVCSRRRNGLVVTDIKIFAVIFVGLLVLYFILMKFVPVPGYGPGNIDSPDGNLAAFFDRAVFGQHLWAQSKTWDPEGILSTLPAIATVLSGVLCGWWLRRGDNQNKIFLGLMIAGLIGVALAFLFHPFFPINKKIWTSSFVLLTSGLAMLVLGLIYYYMDVAGKRRGATPFLVFGSNAIVAYFLSSFFGHLLYYVRISSGDSSYSLKDLIYSVMLEPIFGPDIASLVFALLYVMLWLSVLSLLYKKRIYVRL